MRELFANSGYLVLLFFAHWVGDFLLQSSTMANRKKSSLKWLTIHVAVYSLSLFLFTVLIMDWKLIGWFILINAVLHWITDFFTSKLASRFSDRPRIFYSIIGFDQLIHYSCLVLTLEYMTG